jgi:hypothetical protein
MKSVSLLFPSLFFLFFSICGFAQKQGNMSVEHSFFTQSDQVNWVYVLKDKTTKPADVFKMDNGVLQITGISNGYLRTKKCYSNYELSTEWRWTKTLGNSGVLVHIQPQDTIWPACYQVQQKAGDAGDIICMTGLWAKECTDHVKFTVKKMQVSNEKPPGEWNSVRIICKDNTLRVFINGILQNYITGLTASKGFIGFQNEGKSLEFRNLTVTKLIELKK